MSVGRPKLFTLRISWSFLFYFAKDVNDNVFECSSAISWNDGHTTNNIYSTRSLCCAKTKPFGSFKLAFFPVKSTCIVSSSHANYHFRGSSVARYHLHHMRTALLKRMKSTAKQHTRTHEHTHTHTTASNYARPNHLPLFKLIFLKLIRRSRFFIFFLHIRYPIIVMVGLYIALRLNAFFSPILRYFAYFYWHGLQTKLHKISGQFAFVAVRDLSNFTNNIIGF